MNIKDRLKTFISHLKLTNQRFEIECGLSNGYISNIRKGIGEQALERISNKYPQLNRTWLVFGDGEMLTNESLPQSEETVLTGKIIPFFDAETAAGAEYGMNMEAVSRPISMIEIGSVLRDSESAIRVYGNSMVPNYPAGCVIGLKLHTDSFIEPGRVYVVETRDNRYLKRLYYTDNKVAFLCMSDNQMKYEDGPRKGLLYYQDFEIPIEEVIRLHRVVGVIKRNIL